MSSSINYLITKIISRVALIMMVIVFNFFLFRILPGDPVRALIHSPRMTREAQEKIRKDFGLDKPVWINISGLSEGNIDKVFDSQFFTYLKNLSRGNLGISFATREVVSSLLLKRLLATILLTFSSFFISIFLGLGIGLVSAWRRGTWIDTSIMVGTTFAWAFPPFFLGTIILILASSSFPIGGMTTPGIYYENVLLFLLDVGKHLLMPMITLAVVFIGEYVLIMRNSMIEVLTQDYINTARSKGVGTKGILFKHAFKNALLPVITIIAINFGYLVGGAIQVETVFSWPGIGRLIYESVYKQDYPVLQGIFLIFSISVITANLLADILYSKLDPRIRD